MKSYFQLIHKNPLKDDKSDFFPVFRITASQEQLQTSGFT